MREKEQTRLLGDTLTRVASSRDMRVSETGSKVEETGERADKP
jgi:hypothetical protein